MSAEEDTELRDLVIQSLENNGILAKIKAQLRASIFLSLEDENSIQNKTPFLNKSVKSCLESSNGRLLFLLVREFLEFFNLQHTISVFEPESYLNSLVKYQGREKLIEELHVNVPEDNLKGPILLYILEAAKNVISVNNTDSNKNFMKSESNRNTDKSYLNCSEDIENVSIHSLSAESELSISNTLKPITAIQTKKKVNITNKEESDLSGKCDVKSINGDLSILEKEKSTASEKKSVKTDYEYISNDSTSSQSNPCNNVDYNNVLSEYVTESNKTFTPELFTKTPIEENDKNSENQGKSNICTQDLTKSKSSFISSTERLKSISNTEKFKPLSTLSSLHDLPPLTLNKTRTDTILLPSLYSKEFRSPRDTLFDLETDSLDNYEEDFMIQNENYVQSKSNT